MKQNNDLDIQSYLVLLAIFAAFWILSEIIGSIKDTANWNNGYHECGGEWTYQQAIGHKYSTKYLYECDKCGETYEFRRKR